MLKRLALAITTLAISAMALAQTVNAEDIPPTVVIAPHLQDLGSEDVIIGRELADNATFVGTTLTLSLVQDPKGRLVGNATFQSSKSVPGQPSVSMPVTIPVKGKIQSKAKSPSFTLEDGQTLITLPADISTVLSGGTYVLTVANTPIKYADESPDILIPGFETMLDKNATVKIPKGTNIYQATSSLAIVPAGSLVILPAQSIIRFDDLTTATLNNDTPVKLSSSQIVANSGPRPYDINGSLGDVDYTYVLKGKLKVQGGADYHSRTVAISISGKLKPSDKSVLLYENEDGISELSYESIVKISGLGFGYNYSANHKVRGRNWFGIKPLVDTAGYKKLTNDNQGYFEIGYPGAYEVIVGTVTNLNPPESSKIKFEFKGKSAQGNLIFDAEYFDNKFYPYNVSSYYIATKAGIENVVSNALNYVGLLFYIFSE